MGSSIQPIIVRFQAQGAPQVSAAFNQLGAQATRTGQQVSRTFIDGGTRASAFGRQSVQAFNAAGFAASQFAATGTAGFRNLATSAASFASFFGAGGLIASGVISLGLVLGDFWQRQRKEIEATQRFIEKGLGEVAARRARVKPVAVAEEELAAARKEIQRNQQAQADLLDPAKRTIQTREAIRVLPVDQKALNELVKERAALLDIEDTRLRALNEARAKAAETTKEGAKATGTANNAARDAERALEAEIDALVQLGRQGQLSIADMARLIQLQEQFTKSVRDGTLSLEQRAAASKRLTETDRGLVIPTPPITGITETRTTRASGAATTLPAPNIPVPPPRQLETTTNGFGEAFAASLQSGLAAGVTQFIASGDITAMWNNVGSAIVSGLATINPWLAIGGGILQGLIGSMLGGGNQRPRSAELPIDIRRVITDPSIRQPVRAAAGPGGSPLYVNTPAGKRQLRAWVGSAGGRGIP